MSCETNRKPPTGGDWPENDPQKRELDAKRARAKEIAGMGALEPSGADGESTTPEGDAPSQPHTSEASTTTADCNCDQARELERVTKERDDLRKAKGETEAECEAYRKLCSDRWDMLAEAWEVRDKLAANVAALVTCAGCLRAVTEATTQVRRVRE